MFSHAYLSCVSHVGAPQQDCDVPTPVAADGHLHCCRCNARLHGLQKQRARSIVQHGPLACAACYMRSRREEGDDGGHVVKKAKLPPAPAPAAVECHEPEATQPQRVDLLSMLRRHFQLFGWVRVPKTERSEHLAHRVAMRRTAVVGTPIIGQTTQKELADIPGFEEIVPEWSNLVLETAAMLGIDTDSLFVVDHKALTAAPGQGGQVVHWDCARQRQAHTKYTVLLVCSLGHSSTALPTFGVNAAFSFSHDKKVMRSVAHLLDPSEYVSEITYPGEIIIFRQSTPHFGVENTCQQGDRVMLFAVLSPSRRQGQDKEQVYPWLFVRYAFGAKSREFAETLVCYKMHDPVWRIQDGSEREGQEAIDCLKHFGLYEAYTSQS